MTSAAPRVHPHQALAVYAEALASGASVAVLGDASVGVGELLVDLGARSVTVWDPDSARVRRLAGRPAPGLSLAPYTPDRAVLGNVDLAIVPDLGLFDQPAELVARLLGLVGSEGVLLLGAQNRDATDGGGPGVRGFEYYELFDLVAGSFKYVTMLAELPFQGLALVALGEEAEAAVSVDTQLAGDARTPKRFLVTASQHEVALESYMVVELPAAPAVAPPARAKVEEQPGRIAALQSAVEAATRAGEEATRRGAAAEARASTLERESAKAAEEAAGEVRRFEEMLRERSKAARALEVELERRDRMVRELVGSLENGVEGAPAAPAADAPAPTSASDDLSAENARLREMLDSMALDAARREGDIRSLTWTIAQLERRLGPDVSSVEGREAATESR